MSDFNKDGGPAYPATVRHRIFTKEAMDEANLPDALAFGAMECAGMTLRDYFAAQAVPSILDEYYAGNATEWPSFEGVAAAAYLLADAMLKERAK